MMVNQFVVIMKVNKKSFSTLLDRIVLEDFSNEFEIYNLFKQENIDKIYRGEDIISEENGINGFNQMGTGVVEMLQSLILIAGTFSSIVHILNYFRKKKYVHNSEQIAYNFWTSQLVAYGLSLQVANDVSKKYKTPFLELLEIDSSMDQIKNRESFLKDDQLIKYLKLLKRDVAKNNIRETIFSLFEIIGKVDNSYQNQLILISANFESNKKNETLRLESKDEILLNSNRINISLLELIDELIIKCT